MMPEQYFISWQTYYPGTGHNDWQVDFCNFLYYGLKLTKVKRILYGSSAQDINKTVGVSKTHVVRVLKIIVGVTKTSMTVSLTLSTLWQYDYFLKAKRVLLTKTEHKDSNQQYQKKKKTTTYAKPYCQQLSSQKTQITTTVLSGLWMRMHIYGFQTMLSILRLTACSSKNSEETNPSPQKLSWFFKISISYLIEYSTEYWLQSHST